MYGELISRPVPATKTGQAPSRQYRTTPSVLNILAVYLVSSSGVADPSLTSEESAMPLPSLGSAVGSGVTCGSPWNRKGMVLRSVLSTNTKQASPQSVHFYVNGPVNHFVGVALCHHYCINLLCIYQVHSSANILFQLSEQFRYLNTLQSQH